MAINWTTSQGQPADSVGANGDMDYDYQNRFVWGPKGNVTSGSWVGTANNFNPLYGTNFGQAPGFSAASTFQGTLSSTPQFTTQPGTTTQATFTPTQNTSLVGVMATTNAAGSLEVYNITAGSSVVSGLSFSASTTGFGSGQPYLPAAYPLTANNTYGIRLTGSASAAVGVLPVLMNTATVIGQCVSSCSPIGFASNTSFNTTGQVPTFYGSTVGAYIRPIRPGFLYQVVGTFTPTGTSNSSNYVNIIVSAAVGTGSSTTFNNFGKLYGTGKQTSMGVYAPTQLATATNTQYWFTITADTACTGTLVLDLQIVQ